MDSHVSAVCKNLEGDDVSGLILVQVLSEDVSTLGVSLAPLLGLGIEKLQAKDTLSELVHHRSPEHGVDLVSLPAEERVDVGQLAEEVAASVSAALLVTSRD